MLTFFRKIGHSLVNSGSTRRYLLYAIGEVALVVIGILIALQINNWNEIKKARNREVKILKELQSNLKINSDRLIEGIELENKYFRSAKIIVNHLDNKLPYHDSLAIHFQLSQLSHDILLVNSAFETIKSIGLDMISNDTLRNAIIELFDANYETMIRNTRGLEDQFWPGIVLPLWIKHLRNNSMDKDDSGQSPIDYNALLADTDYVSMLEKRGVFRRNAAVFKTESLERTQTLIDLIKKELQRE